MLYDDAAAGFGNDAEGRFGEALAFLGPCRSAIMLAARASFFSSLLGVTVRAERETAVRSGLLAWLLHFHWSCGFSFPPWAVIVGAVHEPRFLFLGGGER